MHTPDVGLLGHSMTVGGDELHVHWAAAQVPNPQSRPQDPQCSASVTRLTHDDPHSEKPDAQAQEKFCPKTLASARVTERLGGEIA
jgi:hypothetical protein